MRKIRSISPRDDTFHGSDKHWAAEWWYFDANLENGYSLVVTLKTYSKKNHGFVSPSLELYKDGVLKKRIVEYHLFKNFESSESFPLVKLFEKNIINFDIERYIKNKEWVYYLDFNFKDNSVKLEFKGTTDGFKYLRKNNNWAVPQPKALVSGEIMLDKKKMEVKGVGYHDHNWDNNLATIMNNKGWFWGKITSENYNIVWAKIVKSKKENELIAFVNVDDNGFYVINPEKICFKENCYVSDHRRKKPTDFVLKFEDVVNNKKIEADVKMKADETQFIGIFVSSYWRCHVASEGFISVESKKENIDKNQIMELIKFG